MKYLDTNQQKVKFNAICLIIIFFFRNRSVSRMRQTLDLKDDSRNVLLFSMPVL